MPIRVGIVGATGYTGGELMRFLLAHPEAQLVHLMRLTSEESIPVTRVHPALRGIVEVECHALDETALTADVDVVFLAVPHRAALQVAPALLDAGIRVVDLSADFRFKDASIYEAWYEVKHTALEWLQKAVYGLPELHRDAIRTAQLVANPGCYPISAILALLPLLRNQLVQLDSIVIDSKSGVSGAGRSKLSLDYHYPEVFGDFRAYNVAAHRHTPEIEQELSMIAGQPVRVTFTPHLLPISRGILTTAYAQLRDAIRASELHALYHSAYNNEPFVRVLPEGTPPRLKDVVGSNYCDVNVFVDERTHRVIAISAIDNLAKGAASNAIQNMNLMFGLDERLGLTMPALSP